MTIGAAAWRGGSSPPSPWTPADIQTHLWLDVSDPSARTVVSNAVSQLLDKSGNGQSFSALSTSNRPDLITAGLGGLDVASFNGTNNGLTRGSNNVGRAASTMCMAFLVRPDVVNSDRRLWNSSTGTDLNAARLLIGFNSSGRWRVGGRRVDGGSYAENTSVPATAGQWVIMVACFDYATASLSVRVDGEIASTTPFLDAGSTSDTNSNRASFGSGFDAENFFTSGRMAEVVFAPSTGNVEKIEGYLAHKWSMSGLLPPGHPYKSAPPAV